jgi:O-antigen ligase
MFSQNHKSLELHPRTSTALLQWTELLIPIALGLLIGIASVWFSSILVFAALSAAVVFALFMLKRPEIILLIILVGIATFVNVDLIPRYSGIYATDFLLLSLLGLIAVRWLVDHDFKLVHTPLDWPLLCYYGFAMLSTFIAIAESRVTPKQSLDEVRYMTYYLSFFVVTNLVREKRQLRTLLRGILFLAVLVAVAMIVQYVLGTQIHLLAGRVENLTTEGTNYEGIARIIPPGEPLLFGGFVVLAAILVLNKLSATALMRVLLCGLLGLAIILTFRRSVWAVTGLALLIIGIVAKQQDRRRFLGWGVAVVVTASLALVLVNNKSESQTAQLTKAFTERFQTLFEDKTFEAQNASTLRWRDFEYQYAIPQILAHPVFGLGLGAKYRPYVPGVDYEKFDGRGYIHNGHLFIMMKAGMLSYLGLLWLTFAFLKRGFKNWRRIQNGQAQAIVLGITLAYLGTFISAISEPRFCDWNNWVAAIGIMMGINEVIISRFAEDKHSV